MMETAKASVMFIEDEARTTRCRILYCFASFQMADSMSADLGKHSRSALIGRSQNMLRAIELVRETIKVAK